MRENREIPHSPVPLIGVGPPREGRGRTPGMYERGKSDRPVVPTKPPNKAIAAEVVEGSCEARGTRTARHAPDTEPGQACHTCRIGCAAGCRGHSGGDHVAPRSSPCDARPKPGAQCGSSARWDLRGGRPQGRSLPRLFAGTVCGVYISMRYAQSMVCVRYRDLRAKRRVGSIGGRCNRRRAPSCAHGEAWPAGCASGGGWVGCRCRCGWGPDNSAVRLGSTFRWLGGRGWPTAGLFRIHPPERPG